jgi:hypothetical protein
MNRKYISAALAFLLIGSIAAILLLSSRTLGGNAAQLRSTEHDRQALIDLENEWLNATDAQTLDRILASDFLHRVFTGRRCGQVQDKGQRHHREVPRWSSADSLQDCFGKTDAGFHAPAR